MQQTFNQKNIFFIKFTDSVGIYQKKNSPVGWDCRIRRLHFCKGVRIFERVSWILH